MDKPITDTDYSQGFYDGYAEGSNKALAAAIAGDKLGIAFMKLVRYAGHLLPDSAAREYGEYVRQEVMPALDAWDTFRDQITEG